MSNTMEILHRTSRAVGKMVSGLWILNNASRRVGHAEREFGWHERTIGNARRRISTQTMGKMTRNLGINVHVKGEPPLTDRGVSKGGPAMLFVGNHMGLGEIAPLGTENDISWIAREDLRKFPVVGRTLEALNYTFTARSFADLEKSCRAVGDTLKSGRHVGLFPEGRSGDGSFVLTFKKGFLRPLFDDSGAYPEDVKIQPFAIRLTHVDGIDVNEAPELRGYFSQNAGNTGHDNPTIMAARTVWAVCKFLSRKSFDLEITYLPPFDPKQFSNVDELSNKLYRDIVPIATHGAEVNVDLLRQYPVRESDKALFAEAHGLDAFPG